MAINLEHMTDLTVVILTFNEELHIRRILKSLHGLAEKVIIVDSFSTDDTVNIAQSMGATVYQNPFVNYAKQFEWALENSQIDTAWVMRMDADEYVSNELFNEIQQKLGSLSLDINGVILKRQVHFMGQWIKFGGYYPVKLLRIWRNGMARIEQRWMDEHMILKKGNTIEFKYDIIDDNQNSITWWTTKHNSYATREAIDLLSRKYHIMDEAHSVGSFQSTKQAQAKRWYKNNLYLKMPMFLRAFLYFIYRYWVLLGFLDGRKGLVWHFLQAFWYRFLVDAKVMQIEWWAKKERKSIQTILEEKFKFKGNE